MSLRINSTKAAYLAGIFDCTGFIRSGYKGTGCPAIGITRSDPAIIVWLYSNIGGNIYWIRYTDKAKAAKYSDQNVWIVTRAADVLGLISAIMPYVRVRSRELGVVQELASAMYKRHGIL